MGHLSGAADSTITTHLPQYEGHYKDKAILLFTPPWRQVVQNIKSSWTVLDNG